MQYLTSQLICFSLITPLISLLFLTAISFFSCPFCFFNLIFIFLLFLLFCYYLQCLKSVWAAALLHSVIFADFSVSACRSYKGRVRLGWCCLTGSGHIIRPKVLLATTFFSTFSFSICCFPSLPVTNHLAGKFWSTLPSVGEDVSIPLIHKKKMFWSYFPTPLFHEDVFYFLACSIYGF